MKTTFDHIIWGPSLQGIKKALELKNIGQDVLLAGKFGFPGGKASESLASLLPALLFDDGDVFQHILREAEKLTFGILFRNAQWVLFHPEAIKRICWQLINDNNLPVLFHVIPLEITTVQPITLKLFGREGALDLHCKSLTDLSDDRYLDLLSGEKPNRDLVINCFFSDPLPMQVQGFQVIRRFETPIGEYVSISLKNIPASETERTFNRELDRLSKVSWKQHQARILMVPVYPEIKAG